ncbi:MAG: hypothetical protein RTU30_07995 [Candidatus Thorarchaeota archaeon]
MADDEVGESMIGDVAEDDNEVDVGSLFRGTATVALVSLLLGSFGMIVSLIVYAVSRPGGFVELIELDVAFFLLVLGAMVALFFFLGAMGFFIRVNHKLGRYVMKGEIGSVDINRPGVKTVIFIYTIALGLILILGMWGYWLAFKYYLSGILEASQSVSFLAFVISTGIMFGALLIIVVLSALGRTVTGMIKKVLDYDE